jgi:mono/diheme cytochrome c family protein
MAVGFLKNVIKSGDYSVVRSSSGWLLLTMSVTCCLPVSALSPSGAAGAPGAAVIFRSRCTGCHTYGQGIKVGPDLKGVTARRQRPWLMSFIRSSSQLIRSGNPVAVSLFTQFKQERMPDWTDLSPQQVEGILDYLAADGPAQKAPDDRNALTATAGEVEMGRWLFEGKIRLSSGTQACSFCHAINDGQGTRGGTFGPELTATYSKYQDKALTDLFKSRLPFHLTDAPARQLLTPVEAFDLKAYLGKAAGLSIAKAAPGSSTGQTVTLGALKAKPGNAFKR